MVRRLFLCLSRLKASYRPNTINCLLTQTELICERNLAQTLSVNLSSDYSNCSVDLNNLDNRQIDIFKRHILSNWQLFIVKQEIYDNLQDAHPDRVSLKVQSESVNKVNQEITFMYSGLYGHGTLTIPFAIDDFERFVHDFPCNYYLCLTPV